ncbi:MAG: hypothetical protein STSR0008_26230 [Ignavibacterium sp.]
MSLINDNNKINYLLSARQRRASFPINILIEKLMDDIHPFFHYRKK